MYKMKKLLARKLQSKDGFTLVELIVVLVIMGILTAAIIPTVTGYVSDAKTKVSESNVHMVEQAALLYITDWEIEGGETLPTDLTAKDLADKGYLSPMSETDTNYTIEYSEIKEEGAGDTAPGTGRYTVTVTEI